MAPPLEIIERGNNDTVQGSGEVRRNEYVAPSILAGLAVGGLLVAAVLEWGPEKAGVTGALGTGALGGAITFFALQEVLKPR